MKGHNFHGHYNSDNVYPMILDGRMLINRLLVSILLVQIFIYTIYSGRVKDWKNQ